MLFMVLLATVFHSGAVVQVEAVQVGHVVAVVKWCGEGLEGSEEEVGAEGSRQRR
jgi:hypothetical protein